MDWFFYLETIGVRFIMIWWLAFQKKPFQFWREIWIQVVVILLQLYFLSLFPFIFFRLTVLIITAVDQIPLLDTTETCQYEFLQLIIGFLVVWSLSILVQSALIIVSLRGTILEDELRWHSEYLLYIKLGKYLFIHEVCPPPHFFSNIEKITETDMYEGHF